MSKLGAALEWNNLGLTCLPCYPGSKSILKGYSRDSDMTLSEYVKLFSKSPLNLCLVTGQANNGLHLVVLDFDAIPEWCKWYLKTQVRTYTVQTRRGRHCYFWTEEKPGNLVSQLAEIKCNSAKVMLPPSKINEFEYFVSEDREIMQVQQIEDIIECGIPPSKEKNDAPSIAININGSNNNVSVSVDVSSLTRRSIIQAIKQTLPISYLFPEYVVSGSGMTAGKALAHCPTAAHERGDLNPSLSLDLNTNRFNCFKPNCPLHLAHGGDILDGYRILSGGISLQQAIAELAETIGL